MEDYACNKLLYVYKRDVVIRSEAECGYLSIVVMTICACMQYIQYFSYHNRINSRSGALNFPKGRDGPFLCDFQGFQNCFHIFIYYINVRQTRQYSV